MAKSETAGMQTFDMDLFKLYKDGTISREAALRNADSENDLSLKIGFEGKEHSTTDNIQFDLGDDQGLQAAEPF